MVGIRWNDWKTMPTWAARNRANASSSIVPRSSPATCTAPAVGRSSPAITASMVDLPEPDGPTTPTVSPRATAKSMPRKILTSPAAVGRLSRTASRRTIGEVSGMAGTIERLTRRAAIAAALACLTAAQLPARATNTTRIVALGDSLTAGYGLKSADAFPARLQAMLAAHGLPVEVINAGVSGDTTAGGLSRLDWVLAEKPDAVIVELGANDGRRGIHPRTTYANLDAIITRLRTEGIAVLLAGMYAPPNLGKEYGALFNGVFPTLAKRHGIDLYPFFLEGVALRPSLNLADGVHPNANGVAIIVERILPYVKRLVARAQAS